MQNGGQGSGPMTTTPPVKRSGDVCESVLEPVEGSRGEAKLPFGGRDINRRQEVHMCPPKKNTCTK